MSQGDINALALSIFMPRATISSSPFRFLVTDDPAQAMDPAKVDGLARVLRKVSPSRQVLVSLTTTVSPKPFGGSASPGSWRSPVGVAEWQG
jgi:hypothetical protein